MLDRIFAGIVEAQSGHGRFRCAVANAVIANPRLRSPRSKRPSLEELAGRMARELLALLAVEPGAVGGRARAVLIGRDGEPGDAAIWDAPSRAAMREVLGLGSGRVPLVSATVAPGDPLVVRFAYRRRTRLSRVSKDCWFRAPGEPRPATLVLCMAATAWMAWPVRYFVEQQPASPTAVKRNLVRSLLPPLSAENGTDERLTLQAAGFGRDFDRFVAMQRSLDAEVSRILRRHGNAGEWKPIRARAGEALRRWYRQQFDLCNGEAMVWYASEVLQKQLIVVALDPLRSGGDTSGTSLDPALDPQPAHLAIRVEWQGPWPDDIHLERCAWRLHIALEPAPETLAGLRAALRLWLCEGIDRHTMTAIAEATWRDVEQRRRMRSAGRS